MRLAELAGSHAEGIVQIAESAINELLARAAGDGTSPTIELRPRNEVLVRYGVVHARAELPAAIEAGPSPRLTLRLASVLVAMGLKAVVRQPYIHIHGRFLTIALADVPALHPWRDGWRHVKQIRFATAPGALRVGVAVAIAPGSTGAEESR